MANMMTTQIRIVSDDERALDEFKSVVRSDDGKPFSLMKLLEAVRPTATNPSALPAPGEELEFFDARTDVAFADKGNDLGLRPLHPEEFALPDEAGWEFHDGAISLRFYTPVSPPTMALPLYHVHRGTIPDSRIELFQVFADDQAEDMAFNYAVITGAGIRQDMFDRNLVPISAPWTTNLLTEQERQTVLELHWPKSIQAV